MTTTPAARTITRNLTFAVLGDTIVARFLKDGDLVVGPKGRYFEIGTARCDSDTNVVFSTINELGGIEALTFARDQRVPLVTVI